MATWKLTHKHGTQEYSGVTLLDALRAEATKHTGVESVQCERRLASGEGEVETYERPHRAMWPLYWRRAERAT